MPAIYAHRESKETPIPERRGPARPHWQAPRSAGSWPARRIDQPRRQKPTEQVSPRRRIRAPSRTRNGQPPGANERLIYVPSTDEAGRDQSPRPNAYWRYDRAMSDRRASAANTPPWIGDSSAQAKNDQPWRSTAGRYGGVLPSSIGPKYVDPKGVRRRHAQRDDEEAASPRIQPFICLEEKRRVSHSAIAWPAGRQRKDWPRPLSAVSEPLARAYSAQGERWGMARRKVAPPCPVVFSGQRPATTSPSPHPMHRLRRTLPSVPGRRPDPTDAEPGHTVSARTGPRRRHQLDASLPTATIERQEVAAHVTARAAAAEAPRPGDGVAPSRRPVPRRGFPDLLAARVRSSTW